MPTTPASRRAFFAKVAAGGAAAAVATAAVVTGQRLPLPGLQAQPAAAPEPTGYRETAHVKSYYRTTRV